MKRLLFAGALLFAAFGQALAADLPEPAPPPMAPATFIPTVVPVYNWGGLYYGVKAGYGFGTSKWTFPGASTSDFDIKGWAAGATIGANLQAEAFVFGIE